MSRTEYKYTELERLESHCRQLMVHNVFYSKGCCTPLHKYRIGNEDNFRRSTVVCTAANILQQDIYLFNGSCCRKVAATAVDTRRWLELIPSTVIETNDQPMAGPMSYATIECDFGIPITRHAVKPVQPVEDHSFLHHIPPRSALVVVSISTQLVSLSRNWLFVTLQQIYDVL